MVESISIREIAHRHVDEARELVASVFEEFIAPGFSPQGVEEFRSFIDAGKLRDRLHSNTFMLSAEIDGEMVGVIAIRDWEHVSLLFVKDEHQHEGVGSSLLVEAVKICQRANPSLERVTVNSSPNAVGAYRRMGFLQTEEEQLVKGIRFVPMVLDASSGPHG